VPPLLFSFKDLLQEVRVIAQLARDFLEPASIQILTDYASALEQIQDQRSLGMRPWEIRIERAVLTKPSAAYNPSGKGKYRVFAKISSIWELAARRPPGKKNKTWPTCALVGNASTQISLHRLDADGTLHDVSMWRVEIGDDRSPGCIFHVQVLGKNESPPFPSFIPVPRLPALHLTAAAAIEYVIGELFQSDWKLHAMRETPLVQQWRLIQAHRLERFLDWQVREVRKAATGSPWVRLKTLLPEAQMFLKN
jgi:hypothetical protein